MEPMHQEIVDTAHARIASAASLEAIATVRVQILGRKGPFASHRDMSTLSSEERKEYGRSLNEAKAIIEQAIAHKERALQDVQWESVQQTERIDTTQPLFPGYASGHLHPNTLVQRDLEEVATSMGFMVIDGPELDTDYYTFEALNIPKTHPARDSQDTFYVEGHPDWCMRSHVSNMQVRLIQQFGVPLRAAYPGRVFRNEATDASHEHTFYQFEALVIDKGLSIGHLIGVIKALLRGLFRKDVEVRLRPGYFPFVEPGFEMDMSCLLCMGRGCAVCKKTGWVELLGCGLVHPHVLKEAGLDSRQWSGIAFGMGLTRLVMMRYGIEDIRLLMSGDERFLKQF
jgi:phenylalanyl-tRNA synthetase alpha chain